MKDIQRIINFLKAEFTSPAAHAELDWIATQSLPVSMIGNEVSLRDWYHFARRTLSEVEFGWSR